MENNLYENTYNNVSNIAKNGYNMSMTYILLGFSLAAALAWTNTVKYLIKAFISSPNNRFLYHITYAITITLFAVLFYELASKYSNADLEKIPIFGMVN